MGTTVIVPGGEVVNTRVFGTPCTIHCQINNHLKKMGMKDPVKRMIFPLGDGRV